MSVSFVIAALLVTGTPTAGTYEAALARAKASDRPLVIDLYTRWCGWCRRMKRETYVDPAFETAAAERFVFASFDAEDRGDGSRIAQRSRVGSYPTVLVLDSSGRELDRIRGFRTAKRLLADVERITEQASALEDLLAREARPDAAPQVRFDAAMALERAGRHAEAVERYRRLLDDDRPAATRYQRPALWNAAGIAQRTGAAAVAVEAYRRYLERYPGDSKAEQALYRLGRLQRELGRNADALSTYRELLERFGNGRHATAAKVQIEILEAEVESAAAAD